MPNKTSQMEENKSKKLIRSKSGFRMVTVNEDHMSPLYIDEPVWTPDKEAIKCTKCFIKFGFTTRKHHCRRCGLIYCSKCCEKMLELPRMCFIDPVRVCLNCECATRHEIKFFHHDLKVLLQGAVFLKRKTGNIKLNTADSLLYCKLSQDHRFLVLEGSNINIINLFDITDLTSTFMAEMSTIKICYNEEGNEESIQLETTKDAQEKKTGNSWIKAIGLAYWFVNERIKKRGALLT